VAAAAGRRAAARATFSTDIGFFAAAFGANNLERGDNALTSRLA
jgi:hypothetical protein